MSRIDNMQGDGLDARASAGEGAKVMTRIPLLITLAAAAALAGCNKEDHTIVAGPDIDNGGNTVATNGPVELPPTISASKVYRCADNKIVYVDWLSDNKSATIRTEKNGSPTSVTAPEPGKPMTAVGGYSLEGSATASEAKIAVPGHSAQSCKA
jgi:hypothetical protein